MVYVWWIMITKLDSIVQIYKVQVLYVSPFLYVTFHKGDFFCAWLAALNLNNGQRWLSDQYLLQNR